MQTCARTQVLAPVTQGTCSRGDMHEQQPPAMQMRAGQEDLSLCLRLLHGCSSLPSGEKSAGSNCTSSKESLTKRLQYHLLCYRPVFI